MNNINDQLSDWRGGTAAFWQYTVSHSHLEIRLTHPDRKGKNIHVVCEACQFISGPCVWEIKNLNVSEGNKQMRHHVILSDEDAEVKIVCESVLICSNVEPVY